MNLLVISRISIPAKDRTLPAWEYLRRRGHEVIVDHPERAAAIPGGWRPDFMISMGVTVMEETFRAVELWPGVPFGCFNWDCYEWVWEPGLEGQSQAYHPVRGKEYDYVRYGALLRRAFVVWVPSHCTGLRTTQWWGIPPAKIRTVRSAIPWWDHPRPTDEGYALCTLREIPDRYWGRFERVCRARGIPYVLTRHERSYEEYQEAVAHCRVLVSDLYELSTGGLTLLEGYYLGKPCLLSDSPWHGGRDYLGDRATYFRHDDEQAFGDALQSLMARPPRPPADHAAYVVNQFGDERMIDEMLGGFLRA